MIRVKFILLMTVACLFFPLSHAEEPPKTLPPIDEEAALPEGAWNGNLPTDITYGYSDRNPIKVGSKDPNDGPAAERRYLNLLMDRDGNPVRFRRLFSGGNSPDKHILDCYEISLKDGTKVRLWIDMYCSHKAPEYQLPPVGFHRRLSEENNEMSQWGRIGRDEDLEQAYAEATDVLAIRIQNARYENIKPPFSEIICSATVTEVFKGKLKPNDTIMISLFTDGLPLEGDKRHEHIEKFSASYKNRHCFAFADSIEGTTNSTSAPDMEDYSEEMLTYLKHLSKAPSKKE